jgi:hypothetical protein
VFIDKASATLVVARLGPSRWYNASAISANAADNSIDNSILVCGSAETAATVDADRIDAAEVAPTIKVREDPNNA